MTRRWFLVAMFMVWLAAPLSAQQRPDFSGTWVLDAAASQSMEGILEAQGRSYLERKLFEASTLTQRITQTPTTMTIVIESSVAPSKTEVLTLDGATQTKQTQRAGEVKTRTTWEGETLTTVTTMKLADGVMADWYIRRTLTDGGKTLIQKVELKATDGRVWKADRTWRKR